MKRVCILASMVVFATGALWAASLREATSGLVAKEAGVLERAAACALSYANGATSASEAARQFASLRRENSELEAGFERLCQKEGAGEDVFWMWMASRSITSGAAMSERGLRGPLRRRDAALARAGEQLALAAEYTRLATALVAGECW